MPSESIKPPIVLAGIALLAVRCLSLGVVYLAGSGGTELGTLVASLLYFAGEAALLTGGAFLLWTLVPPLRTPVTLVVCLGFPLLILVGLIDVFLFIITGDHLTPSVLRQFAGLRLFGSTNFTEPVKAYAVPIAVALCVVFAAFGAFVRLFWTRGRSVSHRLFLADGPPVRSVVAWLFAGGIGLGLSGAFPNASAVDRPVEVLYLEELLGADGVGLRGGEAASIAELRDFLGLPPGRRWAQGRHPLVHERDPSLPPTPPRVDPPDIIVIVIESMRGACFDFVAAGGDGCRSPRLSALARDGVVLPQYISNGFPSGPGFITMSCSTWPHHKKRIVPDFQGVDFDCLGPRLASLGYRTIVTDGDANWDMQSFWHEKYFQVAVDLKVRGLFSSEKYLFEQAQLEIARHDSEQLDASRPRPLYVQIKTTNPHLPYETPDDRDDTRHWGEDLRENYIDSIEYVDRHIGLFVDYLATRPRSRNTVLLVTGDHANYLDQKDTASLPQNDTVWTGALFYGPERWIGEPRRIEEPASHVDINPTLLAMAGDERPTASLGRNLFGPGRSQPPTAIAIRPGGIRLDRRGQSMTIDRLRPGSPEVAPAFPSGAATAAPGKVFDEGDAARAVRMALTLSYLIEQNRIWDPDLIATSGRGDAELAGGDAGEGAAQIAHEAPSPDAG